MVVKQEVILDPKASSVATICHVPIKRAKQVLDDASGDVQRAIAMLLSESAEEPPSDIASESAASRLMGNRVSVAEQRASAAEKRASAAEAMVLQLRAQLASQFCAQCAPETIDLVDNNASAASPTESNKRKAAIVGVVHDARKRLAVVKQEGDSLRVEASVQEQQSSTLIHKVAG